MYPVALHATIVTMNSNEHPGKYVKSYVLPKDMAVAKAASLMGIGRPALSTFLNGKAELTQAMALRLKSCFGADPEKLMQLQAKYNSQNKTPRTPIAPGRHAPTLVEIKAPQIEKWADKISAREELPALLRRLVHTTGNNLDFVSFPAFDNSQRPGWDGQINSATPTPWIPTGFSGWEFGCGKDAKRKAESDYAKRVANIPPEERHKITFVFVTPHKWPSKEEWAAEKIACGDWKDVRAYDSSNLEEWLEQSAETQIWFAARNQQPVSGYRLLEQYWDNWSGVCNPKLSPKLFESELEKEELSDKIKNWLKKPPQKPFIIAAESRDEVLAFLYCLFNKLATETDTPGACTLVIDTPEALRRLHKYHTSPRIIAIHSDHVEQTMGSINNNCYCIIARPRHDLRIKPDITLGGPDSTSFSNALQEMGISHEKSLSLRRETGRSLTILRRRLSKIPAICEPEWAKSTETAKKLLPMALAGVWHKESPADCEILQRLYLTNNHDSVENSIAELESIEDSPLWETKEHCGVVSRIESLIGIAKFMTKTNLKNFFTAAECVLSETDSALDLPDEKRPYAAPYGKQRKHSNFLRKGISETLVLLAVYGENLFKNHELKEQVSRFIHQLLDPLTPDKLMLHLHNLPYYAEAAPDVFLQLIEKDLEEKEPAVFSLLKPVGNNSLGTCLRTDLLWALECLAWKNLTRVSRILVRLSTVPISDSYANKPLCSLASLYRYWLPCTDASLNERAQSLRSLVKEYPNIGWDICIEQLKRQNLFAFDNYRPRWSDTVSEASQRVMQKDIDEFQQEVVKITFGWKNYNQKMLGDLVENIHELDDEYQAKVLALIEQWVKKEANDKEKAELRELVRQYAFAQRGSLCGVQEKMQDRARATYGQLEPNDLVYRHLWLFTHDWIELSGDETDDSEYNYDKHQKKIHSLQVAAMKELWNKNGIKDIAKLLLKCNSPLVVGESLKPIISDKKTRVKFIKWCLSETGDLQEKTEWCLSGFLRAFNENDRGHLLLESASGADAEVIARLYKCAPFRQHTWRLLDQYDRATKDLYWQKAMPILGLDEAALNECIDNLLNAKRSLAAFSAAYLKLPSVKTSLLKRILFDMVTISGGPETEKHYLPPFHRVVIALEELNSRADIELNEMVQLELMHVDTLHLHRRGFSNLEKLIAQKPLVFIQLLSSLYKRSDQEQDPAEWKMEDAKKQEALARAAFAALERISHIPGQQDDGKINTKKLLQWIDETRSLCADYSRAKIGDRYIGKILSRAPVDDDKVMPCLAVSEAIQKIASFEIGEGFRIGLLNSRGMTSRKIEEGGDQERDLSSKYTNWAKQREIDYPFVGNILRKIANDYEKDARRIDDKAEIDRRFMY